VAHEAREHDALLWRPGDNEPDPQVPMAVDPDEIIEAGDGSPRWRVTRPWEGKRRPRQAKL
jgi:hypothetical protein